MSRLKRVMTNDMVAHTWANQREENDSAWSSNESISFNGDCLKSYSTTIGKHYSNKHGNLTLLSDDRYSSTTGRHLSSAQSAMRGHHQTFDVPWVDIESDYNGRSRRSESQLQRHFENMSFLRWAMVASCKSSPRQNDMQTVLANAKEYCYYVRFFGLTNYLSQSDKRLIKVVLDTEKTLRLPIDDLDLRSSAPLDNIPLNEIKEARHNQLASHILFLLGFSDSDGFDIDETMIFRNGWYSIRSQQFATVMQQSAKEKHRVSMSSNVRDRVSKEWDAMSPKDKISCWRTNGETWKRLRSHIGTFGLRKAFADYHNLRSKFGYQTIFGCRISGDSIQTSGSATIPAKEARILWSGYLKPLWRMRESTLGFQASLDQLLAYNQDHKLARSFVINSVDRSTGLFKVGCHSIPFDEFAIVANELGIESNVLKWRMPLLVG